MSRSIRRSRRNAETYVPKRTLSIESEGYGRHIMPRRSTIGTGQETVAQRLMALEHEVADINVAIAEQLDQYNEMEDRIQRLEKGGNALPCGPMGGCAPIAGPGCGPMIGGPGCGPMGGCAPCGPMGGCGPIAGPGCGPCGPMGYGPMMGGPGCAPCGPMGAPGCGAPQGACEEECDSSSSEECNTCDNKGESCAVPNYGPMAGPGCGPMGGYANPYFYSWGTPPFPGMMPGMPGMMPPNMGCNACAPNKPCKTHRKQKKM